MAERPSNRASTKPLNLALISSALVALVLAAFWPVLSGGFLTLDDPDYFTANAHVQGGLTWSGIGWAFTSFFSSNWHPLTWLSLMLDVSVFGHGPLGPHLVNLLLHAGNTVLLFCILRRMTGKMWRAALVAALFGLHPLRVESVAWVAERKDVLCAFFGFLALLAYARYAQEKNRKHFLAAVALFACSLMSKPMLVTLPFGLLLLDYWPLARVAGSPRGTWQGLQISGSVAGMSQENSGVKWRALILEKWPFFLLSVASSVVTFIAQREGGAVQAMVDFPLMARVGNALVSYARYVGKSFVPVHLALPYPYPMSWPVLLVALAMLLMILWMALAFVVRRRASFFTMGSLWFIGMLVPVIGLVQVGGQSMADRYTYLPHIGLWLALVWTVGAAMERWQVTKPLFIVAAGMALVGCVMQTNIQSRYWVDTEKLMTHSIAVTEKNTLAYFDLGTYYDAKGRTEDAIKCYRTAIGFEPDFARGHMNLATDLASREDWDGAFEQYREVLRLNPDLALAHNNYGVALSRQREFGAAQEQYERALQLDPDYADAHYNLGVLLAVQKRYAEALPYYTAAAKKMPRSITYNNIGYAEAALGHPAEALAAYRKAAELDPNMFEARVNLGNALAKENDLTGAIENYERAAMMESNNPALLNNLGHALVMQKRLEEGIGDYEAALRVAPDFVMARFNLGMALVEQGHADLALGEFEKVLAVQSGNPQAEYETARALAALGRNSEALVAAEEAVRLKPDYAEARELVGRLKGQ